MPRPIPFPTRPKPAPAGTETVPEQPIESGKVQEQPEATPKVIQQPVEKPVINEKPEAVPQKEEIPNPAEPKTEMPSDYNEDNCVVIDGVKIEIKPTKLAYFRNKAAATYNALKNIPLTELFGIKKGVLDDTRDGDQIVYDFLVAVLDDKELVRKNYNKFDADQIDRMIKIFGRINHIDEKYETQRKNREAQGSH